MKFRILLLSILLSIVSTAAQAQNFKSGAFGATTFEYTKINGQDAVITGGRFGWIIDNSIVLGGSYYALVGNVRTNYKDNVNGLSPSLGFNYGGLELEYIFFADNPIHFSADMLLAGGGLYFNPPNSGGQHENYFTQDLLVWQPSFIIEANSVKWLHIDLNLSYRMISSFSGIYGVTKDDLKGFSAGLVFRFGAY